jgi:hypothetical protein
MRYKVIEKRMLVVEYEIEAETDNYGYDLVSCEEIEY